ncbi:MAG: hypothetical protein ACLPTZ_21495, partial [Beijerinckiaceae bacterium]
MRQRRNQGSSRHKRGQRRPPRRPASADAKNLASRLLEVADRCTLFKYRDEGFAQVFVDDEGGGHFETYRIKSQRFRDQVLQKFFLENGSAAGPQQLNSAIETVNAKALYSGKEREVFIRVGELNGKAYIDLGDPRWRAIEIDGDGWRLCQEPPVLFRRPPGMLALPEPRAGGSWSDLRRFINVADDQFVLVQSLMLAALMPRGPFPVAAFHGPQGSAKTTNMKLIKSLIDPSMPELRTVPRNERDLMIAAENSWLLVFDNISSIPIWLSDAMCRIATGGGFSTRALYQDAEEKRFDVKRPLAMTAIGEVIVRPDLLDRSIELSSLPIQANARREESRLWSEFETVKPFLLGTLCDAVACSVKNRNSIRLSELPRMADFAISAT